jgi:uncharacterized membrane protein
MREKSLIERLRNWFLQGIALVAPLAITIAFLIWLGRSLELFIGGLLRGLLPTDWYVPGMGLVIGLAATLAIGLLANLFLVRWLVSVAERLLDRIPLVKSIFQGLKDVSRFFAGDENRNLGRAVSIDIDGMRLVGFVTQEEARLPADLPGGQDGQLAVYLPMSYQLGGYTIYLDERRVTPLDVDTEQAMRGVLTGGSLTQTNQLPRAGGKRQGADTKGTSAVS